MIEAPLAAALILLALNAGYLLGVTRRRQKDTTVTIPKGSSVVIRSGDE
jgi:hypothetical protein